MKKHTPGPWRIGGHVTQIMEDRKGRGEARVGFDRVVATMPPWHEDNQVELEANAHLIAAAPELLQALEGLIYFDGRYGGGEKMDAIDLKFNWDARRKAAQIAIAKARGGK